jgi:ribonuclease P protein component
MSPAHHPENPPTPDNRFPRSKRLTHAHQFEEAFAGGRKYVGRLMVIWPRVAQDSDGRIGIVTSRKVGGAVQRNRARRMLREAFRPNKQLFRTKCDFVVVARYRLASAKLDEVESELLALADKAGLLCEPGESS